MLIAVTVFLVVVVVVLAIVKKYRPNQEINQATTKIEDSSVVESEQIENISKEEEGYKVENKAEAQKALSDINEMVISAGDL